MSFLTPLYIAGTLFVALPILFHLIRRQPRDRIPFSSLMFLRESPPRVTRRSRLENLLLLFLRACALVLLASAFARPFFREPLRAEADTGDGNVLAIVVDSSASMRRDDLWQQAVQAVSRALQGIRPIDHVALYTFDRQPRPVVTFDEWLDTPPDARSSVLKERLGSLSPTWGSTNLGGALAAAADAVDAHATRVASSGSVPAQRVILISDIQKGSDVAGLRQYEWPDRVSVEIVPVRPRGRTNAALQVVETHDEAADPEESRALRVRITNAAESQQGQFRLRWDGAGSAPTEVYVAPGKSRVVPAPATKPEGKAERLILEGDEQGFDNTVYTVPRKAESVPILFVGGGAVTDTKNLLYYFMRAFPETPSRNVSVVVRHPNDRIAAAELVTVRFAVLADSVPDETADLLRTFVDSGGSLLCVLGGQAIAPSVARVLAMDELSLEEAPVRQYSMLGEIDFQHPVFAPFSGPRFGDFTRIHFWRHRRLGTDAIRGARVLARFDDHEPALVEVPRGHGRAWLLAVGWNPADSQLAVSSKFVPLLGNMLDVALGTHEVHASARVGDSVSIEEAAAAGPVRIERPDGGATEVPAGSNQFQDTSEPGIYTASSGGSSWRFAVNIAPAESQTDPMAPEDIEQLGVRLTRSASSSRILADAERQRHMHAFELESRQKLWRWLLVTLLAVLLVESWLAGRIGGGVR
jgi:hypothetical protein